MAKRTCPLLVVIASVCARDGLRRGPIAYLDATRSPGNPTLIVEVSITGRKDRDVPAAFHERPVNPSFLAIHPVLRQDAIHRQRTSRQH